MKVGYTLTDACVSGLGVSAPLYRLEQVARGQWDHRLDEQAK